MGEIPEYTHEYTVSEETEWDLPQYVIPLAENETEVKIALIDKLEGPIPTVHVDKEVLREKSWDTADEFREDVDWRFYDD